MRPHRIAILLALLFLPLLLSRPPARADTLTDQLSQMQTASSVTIPLTDWKFHQPDITGGEAADFDDSAWQTIAPGFNWTGDPGSANGNVWFRTRYVVPAMVQGISTDGAALRLEAGMDDDLEFYVNGKDMGKSHWDDGHVMLAARVHPGQVFVIALRSINTAGPQGGLHFGCVVYDLLGAVQPTYMQYLQEAQFVQQVAPQATGDDQKRMTQALATSEAQVDLAALKAQDWAKAGASLAAARQTLLTLAPITRQYAVYYVGHAHIDMNWLWTWPDTVDTCHRTWDSAMNLMDEFPDFGFVQSQPGAYDAIRQQFPAEFARMQQHAARGQWDTVSGFWDESDTDMPSGEGLARSLFIGQRFFKTYFGHYAITGWLPDSFGHSWQLPQLMQEVGIENYYHMRCGDGIRYSWWESPDGSRVLKANTDNYDESVTPDQLVRPWQMQRDYGLKEALVVFGVGDHGGGPTRDQILAGKAFQADPLFPQVHFMTADAYFTHLRSEAATKDLPVVDHDLQYTFVGCYTTHADMKKAVRSSENNLYAAEVLSSLAAMRGHAYPVQGFAEAWKPTAFAQFHDIMSGTAIHSTYDWMHQQLAPAFTFEQTQTNRALRALTASVDTRGAKAGEQAVAVWNALSFPRSDVVRVAVPNAARFHSARDSAGNAVPVQALDAGNLVFVAPNIPAFGQKTFFLSAASVPGMALPHQNASQITLENPFLRVVIAKDTGLITSIYDKKLAREMIAPGKAANLLQVLGDNGSAWDIGYTGEEHDLTTGADVQLVASGPVCAVVRVTHTFNKSTFTQNITLYRDLPRLDVPSTVEWHEHGQLLKVAFPLAMTSPAARVGIPYGSIDRPITGQENPGQKWMDVSDVVTQPSTLPTTRLSLARLWNQASATNFDNDTGAYPKALLPAAGVHRYGPSHIPFTVAAPGQPDNIACAGQAVPVPAGAQGNTLYILGASVLGTQGGTLTVEQTNGQRTSLTFTLNDWVVASDASNQDALTLAYRIGDTGAQETASKPHLWIIPVTLPAGAPVRRIILPNNPLMHVFAMTLGSAPTRTPLYGLSVLNNCKYGSDTNGSVFRLTLLRSSNNPDPNPDEGTQIFTYSLLPHSGDWRTARSEQAGLALNIPLYPVLTTAHPGQPLPTVAVAPAANLVVGAFKHDEDGKGYILRLFETQGHNTVAHLTFSQPVRVQETDILEHPVHKRAITMQGNTASFPIGHDQIVTLHILGLPDAHLPNRTASLFSSRRQ